ncbi:MAG: conjugal transfer protein TrbI, partial [Methylomonas lenta]|nr:conjugal transfer protein TrbI [Methylomonas lenta]
MKLQQLQEAIKARTSVQIQAPRSAASAPGGIIAKGETALTQSPTIRHVAADIDPTEVYKAKLAK